MKDHVMSSTHSIIERFLEQHPEWSNDVDLLVAPPTAHELQQEYPEAEGCESDTDYGTSYGVTRRSLYMKLRRAGNSHRFADMIACQRGPGLMTDSVFFAGIPKLAEQFRNDTQLQKVMKIAKSHGYQPNPNDVYEPGLARFQGDPEAFVPPSGGRGYIKRLCEKRGWACNGAVKVQHRQPAKDPLENCVPLAEDLIQGHMRSAIQKDPSLRTKRKELRDKIIQTHGIP
jgi:hypothetical protein